MIMVTKFSSKYIKTPSDLLYSFLCLITTAWQTN